jgi:hypothetical protein
MVAGEVMGSPIRIKVFGALSSHGDKMGQKWAIVIKYFFLHFSSGFISKSGDTILVFD